MTSATRRERGRIEILLAEAIPGIQGSKPPRWNLPRGLREFDEWSTIVKLPFARAAVPKRSTIFALFLYRGETRGNARLAREPGKTSDARSLSLDLMFPRLPILSSSFVSFVIEHNFSFLLDWILDIWVIFIVRILMLADFIIVISRKGKRLWSYNRQKSLRIIFLSEIKIKIQLNIKNLN